MEQREVLVTLISATDLKNVATFGKMSVYCVAWIHPNIKVSSPVDKNGNLNPTWNATLKLMADERLVEDGNAVLVVDLYDHGTFGNKSVGSCTIPLSGLKAPAKATTEKEGKEDRGADKAPAAPALEGGGSSSSSNFMAVPVRTKSGKAKGTLNLSIKLGELLKHSQMAAPAPSFQNKDTGFESKDGGAPAYAYPAAGYPPAYGQQPGPAGYPPAYGQQPGPSGYPAAYGQPAGPTGYPPAYGQPPGLAGYPPAYGPPVAAAAAATPAQPYPMYQQAPYPGQMPPPYYPGGGYAPPPPQQKRSGGFLGGGLGAGLAGGALGGFLLGDIIGDSGDGGGCGGGDGGGCGGGCGGG